MGLDTGVDLEALLAIARRLPEIVGHAVPGQVMQAGPSTRRYPRPASVDASGAQVRLATAAVDPASSLRH